MKKEYKLVCDSIKTTKINKGHDFTTKTAVTFTGAEGEKIVLVEDNGNNGTFMTDEPYIISFSNPQTKLKDVLPMPAKPAKVDGPGKPLVAKKK